jgi:putative endonuclease
MAEHNELGKKGEELAARHLVAKGYKIKETNWRYGNDEVDIIAEHNNFLVVVEVKTRQSNYFGEPEAFVTLKKQQFIIRAANAYIEQKNIDLETRFDIVSVVMAREETQVNHIEDAFYPRV